jgi:hypothetical protein
MLITDIMKIEFKINLTKKENFLKSHKFKIIKITQINKINMKVWHMMNNTNRKMKFKHQKIPVDSTWIQTSKAIKVSSMIQISKSLKST